jgi:hypothetical protein
MAITYVTRMTFAKLGSNNAGLQDSVVYKIVDENEAIVSLPSNTNVKESQVAGNYHVRGGVQVPYNWRGRVLWSADGGATWLAEEAEDLGVYVEIFAGLLAAAGADDGVSPGAM